MKQFRATVRVSGFVVNTIVFAENSNFAMKILQAQFGANNVIGIPTQIGNQSMVIREVIKPPTPQQARINSLKLAKDNANKALKAERARQKIANAQQALSKAYQVTN